MNGLSSFLSGLSISHCREAASQIKKPGGTVTGLLTWFSTFCLLLCGHLAAGTARPAVSHPSRTAAGSLEITGMRLGSEVTQDWARRKIESSPRHQEWVKVRYGNRTVTSFLVYPETSRKATSVLVIHENRGLSDWVRAMADHLAEAGYIAIAPDLLSGQAPGGGNTADFADSDAARQAIYRLSPEQVSQDLKAVTDYVGKLPAANGKVVVAGFCWGGSQSFRLATNNSRLAAAFVFYGTPPRQDSALERINCPVYGFYGGNDERVSATIPETRRRMKQAGKTYEPVIYPGAGHGFMRSGETPGAQEGNKKAREEGWKRLLKLLKTIN